MQETTLDHNYCAEFVSDIHLSRAVLDGVHRKEIQQIEDLSEFIAKHSTLLWPLNCLNYRFKNNLLLTKALCHKSFVHEFDLFELSDNERLEFLGDSILGMLISSLLFEGYQDLSEGELSKFRSSLVNGQNLASWASFMGLGQCILLGKGELNSGGESKEALLADVFEAVLAAIYLDGGLEGAKNSLESLFSIYKKETNRELISASYLQAFDSKSRLQELTIKLFGKLPKYEITQLENGLYSAQLMVDGTALSMSVANSKKKAQMELASKVLEEKLLDKYCKENSHVD